MANLQIINTVSDQIEEMVENDTITENEYLIAMNALGTMYRDKQYPLKNLPKTPVTEMLQYTFKKISDDWS